VPQSRQRLRLLLIGDGQCAPAVRELLKVGNAQQRVVDAGGIEQAEAPHYLAACDILVSPHVRNPDGSAFFGSPTKLFEYMAMGKAIVASALDQIGEVLEHDRTAMLVEPGNEKALAQTLEQLCADTQTRARLGAEARRVVLTHYTWEQHSQRILERLQVEQP
jgi:glycosyltransferase involved in cell wall biosynthesis